MCSQRLELFKGRMFLKRGMSDSTITDDPGRQAMCWEGQMFSLF